MVINIVQSSKKVFSFFIYPLSPSYHQMEFIQNHGLFKDLSLQHTHFQNSEKTLQLAK